MIKRFNEKKSVNDGIIDLIRFKSLYGHVLSQLSRIYTSGQTEITTFAVGKKRNETLIKLYANIDFINSLQEKAVDEQQYWRWIGGILEHEVLHLVFDHLSCNFADRIRGNVAVDCVVNSFIDKERLPENCIFPEAYDLPRNKSAIFYYKELEKNKKFQNQLMNGAFGIDGMLYSAGVNSHKFWDEADTLSKEIVKDILKKAKELCNKDYGNVPAEIVSQIDDLLEKKAPLIPWNKILRQFVASAMESNLSYTTKRISKRYGTRPGTKKEDVLSLAVAVDTSGSIGSKELKVFNNEIQWIWKNGASIHVYEADADIAYDYEYKGKQAKDAHGGGGTNLEPVLKEVEGKYDALIYFTDFCAPKISRKYRIPTLWVLTMDMEKEYYPCDWGHRVKIQVNEEK